MPRSTITGPDLGPPRDFDTGRQLGPLPRRVRRLGRRASKRAREAGLERGFKAVRRTGRRRT